ncbi:hypothetical protein L195_g037697 [Trifolium pratense]|uniref:Transmembrane protein n=1 Tax=Trifolium pratense TaxID=57577 RepID=A0A2K3LT32_TRIPR|nr:hypothetical protein L195_g037697 [Trifolium pratense]
MKFSISLIKSIQAGQGTAQSKSHKRGRFSDVASPVVVRRVCCSAPPSLSRRPVNTLIPVALLLSFRRCRCRRSLLGLPSLQGSLQVYITATVVLGGLDSVLLRFFVSATTAFLVVVIGGCFCCSRFAGVFPFAGVYGGAMVVLLLVGGFVRALPFHRCRSLSLFGPHLFAAPLCAGKLLLLRCWAVLVRILCWCGSRILCWCEFGLCFGGLLLFFGDCGGSVRIRSFGEILVLRW